MLHLPDVMCSVYPVFHIFQLKPSTLNTILNCIQPPLSLIAVDSEPEFEILEILDSKIDYCGKYVQILEYLKYEGSSMSDLKGTQKSKPPLFPYESAGEFRQFYTTND